MSNTDLIFINLYMFLKYDIDIHFLFCICGIYATLWPSFLTYIYIFLMKKKKKEKTNISSMVVEGVFTTEKMEKRNLISSTGFDVSLPFSASTFVLLIQQALF